MKKSQKTLTNLKKLNYNTEKEKNNKVVDKEIFIKSATKEALLHAQ